MEIGGFQKFSLIDYPGKISAIIFTQGCNFRCPYCHNPELVNPDLFVNPLDERSILSFLKKRIGTLDAVVITGGEPTLQYDLIEFIDKIKEMGYLVKLDTNGSHPEILKRLLDKKLIDYIAMDIKAPVDKYCYTARVNIDTSKIIMKSIEIILKCNIDYEFRTTVVKSMLSKNDIIEIAKLISGAKKYVLQKFVISKILDESLINSIVEFSDEELNIIKNEVKKYVKECIIR